MGNFIYGQTYLLPLTALVILSFLTACDDGQPVGQQAPLPPTELPFTQLNSSLFTASHNATFELSSDEEWQQFVEKYGPPPESSSDVPEVDFNRFTVLAVTYNFRLICSPDLRVIEKVLVYPDSVIAHLGSIPSPCDDAYVDRPVQLIKFAKQDKPVGFSGEVPIDTRGIPARELIEGSWTWTASIRGSDDHVTFPADSAKGKPAYKFYADGQMVRTKYHFFGTHSGSYSVGDTIQSTGYPALMASSQRYSIWALDHDVLILIPDIMEHHIQAYRRVDE